MKLLHYLDLPLWCRYLFMLFAASICARFAGFVVSSQSDLFLLHGIFSRGILSDLSVALVISLLLMLVRNSRLAVWGVAFFFALAHAANIANIRINFANLNLQDSRFLSEDGFVVKSLLTVDIIGLFLVFGGIMLLVHYALGRWKTLLVKPAALVIYVLLGLQIWLPLSINAPFWQQYNLFEENARALFKRNASTSRIDQKQVNQEYLRFIRRDLTAEPIAPDINGTPRRPNILVIMIEGLSEQFIKGGYMPNLQKFSEENIHYPNFIFHQRFTENGIYSIMCGDMPTMYRREQILDTHKGLPTRVKTGKNNSPNKWSNVAVQGSVNPCLPRVLANNGYNTAFFQASSLGFTNKFGFMRSAGMRMQFGDKNLKQRYPLSEHEKKLMSGAFGMPDRIFMPRVVDQIAKLNMADKPWFAALMTTSTHHPLYVDSEFKGKFGSMTNNAFHTADAALGNMLADLEARGLLANTLLIVTGDESGALIDQRSIAGMMAGNWGTISIRTPDNIRYTSDDYFTQMDIMGSILDYIGMPEKVARGRSLFRKYNTFRPIMFANIRLDRWYVWHAPDQVAACANYFALCQNMRLEGPLFGGRLVKDRFDKDLIDLYIQVARRSDYTNIKQQPRNVRRVRVIRRN